ncbi:hypothetical protein Tco_1574128 [Tanacetum coccineum]
MTITRSGMTPQAIEELINQRVAETLATHKANRDAELVVESQSQNIDDGDNENDRGNRDRNGGGKGNRNKGGNGNGNPNRNDRGVMHVARECTYHDFVKCQPLNFKGAEGVVGLTMCALTWWNAHKRTIRADAAFVMSWRELIKLMSENNDLAAYTQRFQELTMMCTKMVPKKEDQVDKFIRGFPDNIQGNVIDAEPTRLQDVVRIANLKGYAVRNAENKRRLDNNPRDNHGQQPPVKRQNVRGQNVARAYMAGNNERRGYAGPLPYCNKCKLHHEGQCTVRCRNCKKVRYMARDYKAPVATTT